MTLKYNELPSIMKDLKNKKATFTDSGLMLMGNVLVKGLCEVEVRKHPLVLEAISRNDPEMEKWARSFASNEKHKYETVETLSNTNLVPDAALNLILNLLYYSTSKVSTWYAAIFTNNVTPSAGWLSNWAGASSGPLGAELPDASYDESARQAFVFSSAATGGVIESAAGSTKFTLSTGVTGVSAYGLTVNSVSTVAYNLTDRYLAAATRFDQSGGATKTGLSATDELGCKYKLTIANG